MNIFSTQSAMPFGPATAQDIIDGTSNEVFVTPAGLTEAGFISPLYKHPNGLYLHITDSAGSSTLVSSTGYYTVNGSLRTSGSFNPSGSQDNIILPSDSAGVYDPAGAITELSGISSYTINYITQLPEGMQVLNLDGQSAIPSLPELPASLTFLNCSNCTGLTSLPALPASLTLLGCSSCSSLTTLDVSGATALTILDTSYCTSLTTLDVSSLTALTQFGSSGCSLLTTMDVSGLTALTMLDLTDCTALTTLDISGATALVSIGCSNCSLGTAALDAIMIDLGNTNAPGTAFAANNPGSATCNPAPAVANGWTVTV